MSRLVLYHVEGGGGGDEKRQDKKREKKAGIGRENEE